MSTYASEATIAYTTNVVQFDIPVRHRRCRGKKEGKGTYLLWWVVRTHDIISEIPSRLWLRALCFPHRRGGGRVVTEAEESRTYFTMVLFFQQSHYREYEHFTGSKSFDASIVAIMPKFRGVDGHPSIVESQRPSSQCGVPDSALPR